MEVTLKISCFGIHCIVISTDYPDSPKITVKEICNKTFAHSYSEHDQSNALTLILN